MPSYTENRALCYTPEQLFDLVADVERYPEFLPWWVAAKVRKRDGDVYYTDQVIGFGMFRERFSSKTVLERPERIDVTSDAGPFRRLKIQWTFHPTPPRGCLIGFHLDFELGSKLVQRLFTLLFRDAARRVVTTFERRARELYGPPRRDPGGQARRGQMPPTD